MATVPMDTEKVAGCRALAAGVADDVQRYIDRHTSVGVERTILRSYGVDGVDDRGAPLVNVAVERYQKAGVLGRGISFFLGRALLAGADDLQDAAERLAFGRDLDRGEGGPGPDEVRRALAPHTQAAIQRIDTARALREEKKARTPPGPAPLKYVIVATGNIYDDAVQAKAAAHAGADIVAVIRATAQSLLDYVPHGATTEGYGGTFATQENFKIIRRATDEAALDYGRYIHQTNYSSGLCMSEIAWMGAVEGLDMLLNDAMYGILFRDINMCRNFVDQYVSRRFIARSGIVINTGEDNYLTTADAVDKAHTVLASQFINEAFALRAGVTEEHMGLGHAYEIDPWREDSFLYEIAQAQLIRQVFPRHPIKWMPPTKHKTGDVFQSHVHDALFNLVGIATDQSIELLGMFSEAIHNPMLMDRYLSLKATRYVFNACKHLGDEIEWKRDGIVAKRAALVLDEAHDLLVSVSQEGLWDAMSRGAFADVKRTRTGGKGYAGVFERSPGYLNPVLELLEANDATPTTGEA
ncbi:MAG: D-lysine 5,6-aminomutase subunit alpha [Myxococcales bacterium]|nr:D-lysine 5,6-aminomutase subunit alpha [Myxococcales bacterium]HQY63648.1 lysine 5,6-aminomutase subunit alpha [Polyangiaceae bacterium]